MAEEVLYTPSDSEIQEIVDEVNKLMNEDLNSTNVTWESLISAANLLIQRCDELTNFSISMKQFNLLKIHANQYFRNMIFIFAIFLVLMQSKMQNQPAT